MEGELKRHTNCGVQKRAKEQQAWLWSHAAVEASLLSNSVRTDGRMLQQYT